MNILYQDNHMVVAFKPYGVLSEEADQKPNMPALLREALGCEPIYPVHRLDRTTQGLMVYAKTEEAARRLSGMLQRGEIAKTYLAVVEGVPVPDEGAYSDLLYYDLRRNKSYVVKRRRKGVKEARLTYEVLKTAVYEGQTLSLVSIRLLTGRTHQIRVQFASRKLPLAGDRRYGSRVEAEQIMLCSAKLSFVHPFTGEALCFSDIPTNEYFAL